MDNIEPADTIFKGSLQLMAKSQRFSRELHLMTFLIGIAYQNCSAEQN